jgi:hypothetical protein
LAVADTFNFEYESQGEVLEAWGLSRAPVHLIRGPIGSGKTWRAIFKMIELCCDQRPNQDGVRKTMAAVVRKTYPEIKSSILKDVQQLIPPELGKLTLGHPPQLELDFDLDDGTRVQATIQFLALDVPADANKVRGMNISWAWINEANLLSRDVFDMVAARTGRYKPGTNTWAGVFADCNPWNQDHWMQEVVEDKKKNPQKWEGWEVFVQPPAVIRTETGWRVNEAAENQALLKTGYIERILTGKREDWIRVNLGNEIGFSFDGKPVHPDYSDAYHVAKEPLIPSAGVCYIGLDFGLTPAAVFWQRQGSGCWWGFDELVEMDMHNEAFARLLKARIADWRTRVPGLMFKLVGDPSGDNRSMTDGRTTLQMYRLHGLNVLPASSNDPQVRRDALIRPLTRSVGQGKPGLLLSPHMTHLRKSLAGAWSYKKVETTGPERFKDEPDKSQHSHVGEAAEYGLMDAGEHAIRNADALKQQQVAGPVMPQKPMAWDPFRC